MVAIRPVSDLRNKFPEIEELVHAGEPVFLTKNGYGSMVVISLEQYSQLVENIELALDQADMAAMKNETRLAHHEVFNHLRERLNG